MPKLTKSAALDEHRSRIAALKSDCRSDWQLARAWAAAEESLSKKDFGTVCSDFRLNYSSARLALATKPEPRPNAAPGTTADSATITTAAGTGTTIKKRGVK
jgi:hypothetical protein